MTILARGDRVFQRDLRRRLAYWLLGALTSVVRATGQVCASWPASTSRRKSCTSRWCPADVRLAEAARRRSASPGRASPRSRPSPSSALPVRLTSRGGRTPGVRLSLGVRLERRLFGEILKHRRAAVAAADPEQHRARSAGPAMPACSAPRHWRAVGAAVRLLEYSDVPGRVRAGRHAAGDGGHQRRRGPACARRRASPGSPPASRCWPPG